MTDLLRPRVGTGTDNRIAGGELTIDLDALRANYRALVRASGSASVAGVVKADAYGLGIDVVVPTLLAEGCEDLFVAMPAEGIAARAHAPEARIFVLTGLFSQDIAALYAQSNLIPVLNTPLDVAVWESFCGTTGQALPCAIHVDTGMSRLGLSAAEALALAEENSLTQALNITLLMSHLSCGDEPEHPLNAKQLATFTEVSRAFPGVRLSLANSPGVELGEAYHFALTRPGISLYTGMSTQQADAAPVVKLTARVVQVRQATAGDGVSYGATELARDSILAVASVGYADGFLRSGSGDGVPLRNSVPGGARGYLNGQHVPVIGRVTMDLTIFDVTDLGLDAVKTGDRIELIGPDMPIEVVAKAAGTIPYEILTSLGSRYHRRIVGAR